MEKLSTASTSAIILCEVLGAQLNNHVIQSITGVTETKCLFTCVKNSECVSLNYIISSQTCELNNAGWSDWWLTMEVAYNDYKSDIGSDYVHYTSSKTGCI